MVIISQIIVGILSLALLVYCVIKKEFKASTQDLMVMALLVGLGILLGTYFKLSLPLMGPETFEIKFDTLPLMVIGFLYGPGYGLVSGFIMDMIQLAVFPSSFPYFGFTFNLMLTGFLAGLIFRQSSKGLLTLSYGLLGVSLVAGSWTLIHLESFKWIYKLASWILLVGATGTTAWLLRRAKDPYDQKAIVTVVVCEFLIQTLLTSLWLMIMFNLPFGVLVFVRLARANFLIWIGSAVLMSLKRLPRFR